MGDMQRAIGVGVQSDVGVATDVTWLSFVEDYSHRPNLTFDVPKFKTNQRWMEQSIIAKTRFDEVTIRGRLDSSAGNTGLLLTSAFGSPSGGVYLAGQSNSPLLTVAWYDGIEGLMWQMIDGRVNTYEISGDAANGTVSYQATIRGVQALPVVGGLPTITFSPPGGNLPFGSWQSVLTRGAAAVCVVTWRMGLTNNFDPFYCTPLVDPTTGTEAGLFPSRFTEGEVVGTWDIVYEYLGEDLPDPHSSFYNFRHQINEDWHILCTDPAGPTSLLIDLPKVGLTTGDLDRSKPNVLQHVAGSLLYSTADTTGALITLG